MADTVPEQRKLLTKKQIRFSQAYARCLNGARAAREAGVPPGSAARVAHKWLADPKFDHVLEYVNELLADDAAQRQIDWDILRQRLRSRLSIDPRGYWKKNGQPRNPRKMSHERAQHIQGFTFSKFKTYGKDGQVVQEGSNASLTLSSDKKAEEMLGRHSGFFSRESTGDQFNDYLAAEQELASSLSQLSDDDEDGDDDEEGTAEEAAAPASSDEAEE